MNKSDVANAIERGIQEQMLSGDYGHTIKTVQYENGSGSIFSGTVSGLLADDVEVKTIDENEAGVSKMTFLKPQDGKEFSDIFIEGQSDEGYSISYRIGKMQAIRACRR